MTEFFRNGKEFLDLLHFTRNQRQDPAVTKVEIGGSTVVKGAEGNDWDILEERTDVEGNEVWVNTATGKRSGKNIDMFVKPPGAPDPPVYQGRPKRTLFSRTPNGK